jgi:hypothetical protein
MLSMKVDGVDFHEETITLDPEIGNGCSTDIPETISGDTLTLQFRNEDGDLLFEGAVELSPDQ